MTVLAQTLSNDIRVMSGLRSNPLFSDAQIVELLNDALDELRDKFVASLGHWFRNTVTFTLTGNAAGTNTFDLTTIPDFQMDQGLNFYPGGLTSPPIPVHRLGSFAERGLSAGTVTLGYTGSDRVYFTNGDLLFVDPYAASSGTYKLIYTPQKTPLAIPTLPSDGSGFAAGLFAITAPNVVTFAHCNFLQANTGDSLVISNSVNGNNGSFPIASVTGPNSVTVTGTLVNENSASGVTAVDQPAGTRVDLPAILTPSAMYLKLHTSIAIRMARKQPLGDFNTKLQIQERRIATMSALRSEGPKQAPITRLRRRRGAFGYIG